jgi:hypothetical protein
MARNPTSEKMEERFVNQLNVLARQIREMKTFMSPNGYFVIPKRASDPPVTKAGEFGLYYNTGSSKVRKSYNGGAWADTTI